MSYDVVVKNTGASSIEDQLLWVHFVSAKAKTDSKAAFSIPSLATDASATLHVGPFKMLESGEYCPHVGANKGGALEAPIQVTLNYMPNQCTDSITSYTPAFATLLIMDIILALAGAIFVGWYHKKRK